jgi:hypothetical protein
VAFAMRLNVWYFVIVGFLLTVLVVLFRPIVGRI